MGMAAAMAMAGAWPVQTALGASASQNGKANFVRTRTNRRNIWKILLCYNVRIKLENNG